MPQREGLQLETALESDSAALNGLLAAMREDPHGDERVIDWLHGEESPRVCQRGKDTSMTEEYVDNGATSAEYAMNEVLKAEADARQSVAKCSNDAAIILQEARLAAKRVVERADRRITSIHRRSSQAVAAAVSQLEREQRLKLSKFDSAAVDMHAIAAVVEQIAELLTTVDPKSVLTRPVD